MKTCTYCGKENAENAVCCVGCGLEIVSAEAGDSTGDDGSGPLAVLASFNDAVEASILLGRLEQAGIEACVPEDLSASPFGNLPISRVTVRVAQKDLAVAKAILASGLRPNP